jgi:hypothetical protein
MHHGALPYVDVWDRKPFGLFAIYYLITGISPAPIAYQIAASLFAAATAAVIAALGARWTKPVGGLLAGVCYLFWLAPTQGFGGQTPLFYNLFIAGAALLLVRSRQHLKRGVIGRDAVLCMLLAGCAVTIKTTALFEAAFLGLFAVWTVARSGHGGAVTLRHAALYAAIGAAPMLLIGAAYWLGGHGPEFLARSSDLELAQAAPRFLLDGHPRAHHVLVLGAIVDPGDLRPDGPGGPEPALHDAVARRGALGLVSVPRFYMHYALPLLVPLCVAASPFLARKGVGVAATVNGRRPIALADAAVAVRGDHTVEAGDRPPRRHDPGASRRRPPVRL